MDICPVCNNEVPLPDIDESVEDEETGEIVKLCSRVCFLIYRGSRRPKAA